MKSGHVVAILFAVIALAAVVVYSHPEYLPAGSVTGQGQPTVATNNQVVNQAPAQDYQGPVTVNDYLYDANDNTQTRSDSTNLSVTYYAKNADGTYRSIVSAASGTATVPIDNTIKTIYVGVSPKSGQAYFAAVNSMLSKNPRMSPPTFIDPNGGGTKIWMFPFDMTNIGQYGRGTNNPAVPIYVDAFTQTTVTLTSPADQTSTGTADYLARIKWDLTAAAATSAVAISQVEIQTNSTTPTEWNPSISYFEIPNGANVQRVYLTDASVTSQQISTGWSYVYKYGTDLSKDNFISIPKNGDTTIHVPLVIHTTLTPAGHGLLVTMKVTYQTAAQVYTVISDGVIISA